MNWFFMALRKYTTFTGRSQRSEYWFFYLGYIVLSILAMVLDIVLGTIAIFQSIVALGLFIPAIAVSIRRLHDIGKSGWWMLLAIIPILGLVLLYFFVLDSKEDNIYGENPKAIIADYTGVSDV